MYKVVAFGASSSRKSINKQFAQYVAESLDIGDAVVLDLNDYTMPIYSIDVENEEGIPETAHQMMEPIANADILVISFAEHNGSYTSYFKNVFDWLSRINGKLFLGKKLILLSAATGPRGGKTVLNAALDRFPRHGAEIIGYFSLPSFRKTFHPEAGIIDPQIKNDFEVFQKNLKKSLVANEVV